MGPRFAFWIAVYRTPDRVTSALQVRLMTLAAGVSNTIFQVGSLLVVPFLIVTLTKWPFFQLEVTVKETVTVPAAVAGMFGSRARTISTALPRTSEVRGCRLMWRPTWVSDSVGDTLWGVSSWQGYWMLPWGYIRCCWAEVWSRWSKSPIGG